MDAEGHTLYNRQLRKKAKGLGFNEAGSCEGKGFRVTCGRRDALKSKPVREDDC